MSKPVNQPELTATFKIQRPSIEEARKAVRDMEQRIAQKAEELEKRAPSSDPEMGHTRVTV